MIVRAWPSPVLALFIAAGCGSGDGGGGEVCPSPKVLRYEQPGCGTEAHPICGFGGGDGCLAFACGCDGETLTGCDYFTKPWQSRGLCPGACYSPTKNLDVAFVAGIRGCACDPAVERDQCVVASGGSHPISCLFGIWSLDFYRDCGVLDGGPGTADGGPADGTNDVPAAPAAEVAPDGNRDAADGREADGNPDGNPDLGAGKPCVGPLPATSVYCPASFDDVVARTVSCMMYEEIDVGECASDHLLVFSRNFGTHGDECFYDPQSRALVAERFSNDTPVCDGGRVMTYVAEGMSADFCATTCGDGCSDRFLRLERYADCCRSWAYPIPGCPVDGGAADAPDAAAERPSSVVD